MFGLKSFPIALFGPLCFDMAFVKLYATCGSGPSRRQQRINNMRRNRMKWSTIVKRRQAFMLTIGISVVLMGTIATPLKAASSKDNSGVKILQELENVFVDIADRVKPAVVNISPSTESTAKPGETPRGGRPPESRTCRFLRSAHRAPRAR